jgi:CDGSH iron-sulfur domain-containing protein 3
MSDIQIQITENGPYKVTGDIELLDYDGNPVQTRSGAVFLAAAAARRPSRSASDGTHSKIGFQGAMAAVEEAES